MSDSHDLSAELGPVRDQGPRGTCLAFAVTAAHEQARRQIRADAHDELGEEILYWACKQVDGDRAAGTYPHSAREALINHGQSAAALWPYEVNRDETAATYAPSPAAVSAAAMRRATLRPMRADLDRFRDRLCAGHAIVLGLDLWPEFYAAHHGSLTIPSRSDLLGVGHAVAVVGFSDMAAQLLLRNSWGPTWGDNGHGRLAYAALPVVTRGAWIIDDDVDP